MLRPLHVFSVLAAAMVLWFTTRFWLGHSLAVWSLSATLGGWAPLFAAALVAYVQRVGPREDSLAAAWLVRALGVHSVLLWMVGASDWLRGPPDLPARWNVDAGTPLVFLAFAPYFTLCVVALRAITPRAAPRPLASPDRHVAEAHYRAPARRPRSPQAREANASLAPLAVAVVTSLAPARPLVLAAAALTLGALHTPRTLRWAAPTLLLLSARTVSPSLSLDALAMRWPALFSAALGAYALATTLAARRASESPCAATTLES